MFQYNTIVFKIDFQEVLELLGVTRGSISITLEIIVYQKLFIIMQLMQFTIFFTQSWYASLFGKQMQGFKNIFTH